MCQERAPPASAASRSCPTSSSAFRPRASRSSSRPAPASRRSSPTRSTPTPGRASATRGAPTWWSRSAAERRGDRPAAARRHARGIFRPADPARDAAGAGAGREHGLRNGGDPRISRAQSMDALSSQANVAGYKAVESDTGAKILLECLAQGKCRGHLRLSRRRNAAPL